MRKCRTFEYVKCFKHTIIFAQCRNAVTPFSDFTDRQSHRRQLSLYLSIMQKLIINYSWLILQKDQYSICSRFVESVCLYISCISHFCSSTFQILYTHASMWCLYIYGLLCHCEPNFNLVVILNLFARKTSNFVQKCIYVLSHVLPKICVLPAQAHVT